MCNSASKCTLNVNNSNIVFFQRIISTLNFSIFFGILGCIEKSKQYCLSMWLIC